MSVGLGFWTPTTDQSWDPVNDNFQAWPFIYGTLLTSFSAMLIALPISIGIAIFMAELCPEWLRLPLNWLVELLAAIPSVVYAFCGIIVVLPTVVCPVAEGLLNALGIVPGLRAPV